jgi:hypothetical protein
LCRYHRSPVCDSLSRFPIHLVARNLDADHSSRPSLWIFQNKTSVTVTFDTRRDDQISIGRDFRISFRTWLKLSQPHIEGGEFGSISTSAGLLYGQLPSPHVGLPRNRSQPSRFEGRFDDMPWIYFSIQLPIGITLSKYDWNPLNLTVCFHHQSSWCIRQWSSVHVDIPRNRSQRLKSGCFAQ